MRMERRCPRNRPNLPDLWLSNGRTVRTGWGVVLSRVSEPGRSCPRNSSGCLGFPTLKRKRRLSYARLASSGSIGTLISSEASFRLASPFMEGG